MKSLVTMNPKTKYNKGTYCTFLYLFQLTGYLAVTRKVTTRENSAMINLVIVGV